MKRLKALGNAAELATFNESLAKWQAYSDAWVAFVAGERANSGTIWSLIAAGAAEATVNQRIGEVAGWRRLGDGG